VLELELRLNSIFRHRHHCIEGSTPSKVLLLFLIHTYMYAKVELSFDLSKRKTSTDIYAYMLHAPAAHSFSNIKNLDLVI
jgi:hypothetical protein